MLRMLFYQVASVLFWCVHEEGCHCLACTCTRCCQASSYISGCTAVSYGHTAGVATPVLSL